MRKKWIALLAAMVMVACFSVPVYATGDVSTGNEPPPDDDDEVIVVYDWGTGQPVTDTSGTMGQVSGPTPVDIRMDMVGEVPYITRYYEMEDELDLAEVPQGFEQDGYRFTRHELYQQVIPTTVDTKQASRTEVLACETEDVADLLEIAPGEITYEDSGFTGRLTPDVSTIRFEEGERSSYSYTLTETREYPGLPANDAAYIDKTITKNGVTLQLDSIEWVVMGASPTDGGMVPTVYKGIASYSGRATGSKVASYTAYITYTGEVSKTTPGMMTYAVVYRGEPVPVPVVEVKEEKAPSLVWLYCLLGILAVGGAAAFIYFRKRNTVYTPDGLYGDPWDGKDISKPDMSVASPTSKVAVGPEAEQPDAPAASAVPAAEVVPEAEPEKSKADTAASILAAIEGMEEVIVPEKPRRKPANRKETIPLVEKVEA